MKKQGKQWQTLSSWAPKSLQMVTEAMKLKDLLLGRKAMRNLDSILKSRNITLPTKAHLVKAISFPVQVRTWELDHKENWAPKNWCFWTVVLEKTLESPLDCKDIKPVNPKGNQSWMFIGRTDAVAEATWCEELTDWKISWCWETLKAGGKGHNREWDGRVTSLTWWTWVWASSRSWLWTGKPGVCSPWGCKSQTQLSDWTEVTENHH